MIEGLAEVDDHLMEKYLGGETEKITSAELKAAVRAGTISMKLFPVICGASFKNKGVQAMLDAVVDYLPSPVDIPPVTGVNPDTGQPETRDADPKAPFSALAFKIMNDQHVGQLTFVRVYSGTLEPGHRGLQLHPREEGADRAPAADARQQARGDRVDLGGRHRRGGGSQGHPHRRHPLRPEQDHRARGDGLPRPRSSRWRSSPRPRPTTRSSGSPSRGSRWRTRPSRSTWIRRPTRP